MDQVILFSIRDNHPSLENDIKKDIKDLIGYQDYRMIVCQEADGVYTMMAFLKRNEVAGVNSIFNKYDMMIGSWDVTQDVLSGRYQNSYTETFETPVYKKVMSDFISENATVDNILDKISEYGMNSLTKEDREILESI